MRERVGQDLFKLFNSLSVEAMGEIVEAEKLIRSINEGRPAFDSSPIVVKSAGMLSDFQGEVEGISGRAKKLLTSAQGKLDVMKKQIANVTFGNRTEQRCAMGRIECLTYRVVTSTRKFKTVLKASWENIKKLEERKKRLSFTRPPVSAPARNSARHKLIH